MMTGSLGVSFLLPQLFLSQHRLQIKNAFHLVMHAPAAYKIYFYKEEFCETKSEVANSSKKCWDPWDSGSRWRRLVVVRARSPMGHNESATPGERLHPRMPRYVYAMLQGCLSAQRVF